MPRARLVLMCLLAGCGSGGGGGGDANNPTHDAPKAIDGAPIPDAAISAVCTPKHGTTLKLVPVADSLEQPVAIAAPPGDGRLFIAQQTGDVRVVDGGVLQAAPFLSLNVNALNLEDGLLGLAFHPNFAQNGRFFVLYTRAGMANLRLAEYHADPTSDVADATPEKVILDMTHEYDNDNAGTLAFGPDGDLYVSVGDGGSADDFLGHAEDQASLLAKVLRIDVDGASPYSIPADNPWATSTTQAKEAYVWGLRNPWKIALDGNGDLWIGDVSQHRYDEIDVVRHGASGQDFGWSTYEGTGCNATGYTAGADCGTRTYQQPVMIRDNTLNSTGNGAIILGGVYRGACMPDLVGQVFFGNYTSGDVHSFPAASDSIAFTSTTDYTASLDPNHNDPQQALLTDISSFGFDGTGELYIAALTRGAVYRIEVQ